MLVHAGRAVAGELRPFVPDLAERLVHQFGGPGGTTLPPPTPLYPRRTILDALSTA
ncbi:MAG: hypothetical protein ACRD0A_09705 [Acidimicrobiales bacterium]